MSFALVHVVLPSPDFVDRPIAGILGAEVFGGLSTFLRLFGDEKIDIVVDKDICPEFCSLNIGNPA